MRRHGTLIVECRRRVRLLGGGHVLRSGAPGGNRARLPPRTRVRIDRKGACRL